MKRYIALHNGKKLCEPCPTHEYCEDYIIDFLCNKYDLSKDIDQNDNIFELINDSGGFDSVLRKEGIKIKEIIT